MIVTGRMVVGRRGFGFMMLMAALRRFRRAHRVCIGRERFMMMEEERSSTNNTKNGKYHAEPTRLLPGHPQAFDHAKNDQQQSVELVLAGFSVVMQEPEPAQATARPDFIVTPRGKKDTRGDEQDRRKPAQPSPGLAALAPDHAQSDCDQEDSRDVVVHLR